MKYSEIYIGPIIGLTHLAEEPISDSVDETNSEIAETNETENDFELLTAHQR